MRARSCAKWQSLVEPYCSHVCVHVCLCVTSRAVDFCPRDFVTRFDVRDILDRNMAMLTALLAVHASSHVLSLEGDKYRPHWTMLTFIRIDHCVDNFSSSWHPQRYGQRRFCCSRRPSKCVTMLGHSISPNGSNSSACCPCEPTPLAFLLPPKLCKTPPTAPLLVKTQHRTPFSLLHYACPLSIKPHVMVVNCVIIVPHNRKFQIANSKC